MQSDGGGTIKTLEMVRSVHVLTCAAQYLIDLLDQWLEERLGIVVKRKCAAWRLFATVLAVSDTGSIARKPLRSNSTIADCSASVTHGSKPATKSSAWAAIACRPARGRRGR